MKNSGSTGIFWCLLAVGVVVFGCQNPTAHSTEVSSAPALTVNWGGSSGTSKTILPSASDLSVGSYNVILHPSSGADIIQTVGSSATSYSFTNLVAQAYSVTVNGVANSDGTGAVILTGLGSVNLSTSSTASVKVTLACITSTGTGSFKLTFDFSGLSTSGTPSSVGITYLSPGAGSTVTDTLSAGPWTYSKGGSAGSWQVFITATTNSGKVARKMESVIVAQNVTTNGTIAFTDADFSAAYVPVTGLAFTSPPSSLLVGATVNLASYLQWNGGTSVPNNQLVTWSLDTTSVNGGYATVSNGVVTALKAGQGHTVTITATTVDGGYSASCSVTIPPITISLSSSVMVNGMICLLPNATTTLTATLTNATNSYTWTSDNTNIATVTSGGVVTATASTSLALAAAVSNPKVPLTCHISATSVDDPSVTATCLVSVETIAMVNVAGGVLNSGNYISHPPTISSFKMGKYLVTQGQYQAVMGENLSNHQTIGSPNLNLPVENVSWYDAYVFCNKLSIAEGFTPVYSINGKVDPTLWGTVPVTAEDSTWDSIVMNMYANGYRLPTEAEYQWAASGGNLSNGYTYPGSSNADLVAWTSENSSNMTHEVGLKNANELGLYDMSGNVWEKCWDFYSSSLPTYSEYNPRGTETITWKMFRGQSYSGTASSGAGVTYRNQWTYAYHRYPDNGMRVVQSAGTGPVYIPRYGLAGEFMATSSGTLNDTSGNGVTNTPSGTLITTTGHSGVNTNAYQFLKASSPNLNLSAPTYNGNSVYSISFWLKTDFTSSTTPDFQVVRQTNGDSSSYEYHLCLKKGVFYVGSSSSGSGSSGWTLNGFSTALTSTGWHHFVAVNNGGSWTLWVDAVKVASNGIDNNSSCTKATNTPATVSIDSGGTYTSFDMDCLRFYNKALSATEVLELYQEVN